MPPELSAVLKTLTYLASSYPTSSGCQLSYPVRGVDLAGVWDMTKVSGINLAIVAIWLCPRYPMLTPPFGTELAIMN